MLKLKLAPNCVNMVMKASYFVLKLKLFQKIHPRPPVGTGATGAKAPFDFEQWVPGTRPETKCAYHKFSNEDYNCL